MRHAFLALSLSRPRGIYTQTSGDLKWLKEVFFFQNHYGTENCCWACHACKRKCPLGYCDFTEQALWARQPRSHTDYMADPNRDAVLPTIPGWCWPLCANFVGP